MNNKKWTASMEWIFLGIPAIFLVGSLFHFIYDWSGKNAILGIFVPINESVWEHLKLILWPTIIWWLAGYLLIGKKAGDTSGKWSTSCLAALVLSIIAMVTLYYTYTGAFGIHSLVLDILSLFIGILTGQLLGLYIFKKCDFGNRALNVSVSLIILILFLFAYFTFQPPDYPIFKARK